MMTAKKRYQSTWWSLELPENWNVTDEEDCITFAADNGVGVLQISAYRNNDREVTDADLLDFAEDELIEPVHIQNLRAGEFYGFGQSFAEDGEYWRKWWLRNGTLLLYATYICAEAERTIEEESVYQIIDSLKNAGL